MFAARAFLRSALAMSVGATIATAVARPFPLPPAAPAATIDVPEEWRPAATVEGVEGSAGDGAVRLAVQFIAIPDSDAALATAMASLGRRGVAPAPETRRSSKRRYGGLDALKVDFSGTDLNGESAITTILIALPRRTGFVAVSYWGDDEAEESLGNDLITIAESVRPAP
jgi:hypothetical protein